MYRFADDMVLLADDEKTLQKMLNNLNQNLSSYGMKINRNKTKVMAMGASSSRMNIKIENSKLEQVKYLETFYRKMEGVLNK